MGNLARRAAVPGGAARARLAGVLVPGLDANYGLPHLVQKKERAVLVLTEGLCRAGKTRWEVGVELRRRRWHSRRGQGAVEIFRSSGLHGKV